MFPDIQGPLRSSSKIPLTYDPILTVYPKVDGHPHSPASTVLYTANNIVSSANGTHLIPETSPSAQVPPRARVAGIGSLDVVCLVCRIAPHYCANVGTQEVVSLLLPLFLDFTMEPGYQEIYSNKRIDNETVCQQLQAPAGKARDPCHQAWPPFSLVIPCSLNKLRSDWPQKRPTLHQPPQF